MCWALGLLLTHKQCDVETGQMSSVEIGQVSVVETGQINLLLCLASRKAKRYNLGRLKDIFSLILVAGLVRNAPERSLLERC